MAVLSSLLTSFHETDAYGLYGSFAIERCVRSRMAGKAQTNTHGRFVVGAALCFEIDECCVAPQRVSIQSGQRIVHQENDAFPDDDAAWNPISSMAVLLA